MRTCVLGLLVLLACGEGGGGGGLERREAGVACDDLSPCACEGSLGAACDLLENGPCQGGEICVEVGRGEGRCGRNCFEGAVCQGEASCVTTTSGLVGGCQDAPEEGRPPTAFEPCAQDSDCGEGWVCVAEDFDLVFCRPACASDLDCPGEGNECITDLTP